MSEFVMKFTIIKTRLKKLIIKDHSNHNIRTFKYLDLTV